MRGKYASRLRKSSNIVVLRPEVAEAFPNEWGQTPNQIPHGQGTGQRRGRRISMQEKSLAIFENYKIRRHYNEQTDKIMVGQGGIRTIAGYERSRALTRSRP